MLAPAWQFLSSLSLQIAEEEGGARRISRPEEERYGIRQGQKAQEVVKKRRRKEGAKEECPRAVHQEGGAVENLQRGRGQAASRGAA